MTRERDRRTGRRADTGGPTEHLTEFVGREDELREIREELHRNRLVTLVGEGGAGKTSLAVELYRRLVDEHISLNDGLDGDDEDDPPVVMVYLGDQPAFDDEGDLASAVLLAFGQPDNADEDTPATARLLEFLRGWSGVLILDNCEHVPAGQLLKRILSKRATRNVRVLATSREPVLAEEFRIHVGPLEVGESPDPNEPYEALQLFMNRARRVGTRIETPADLEMAHQLCVRLGGLPQALILAAVRTDTMTLADILSQDALKLLVGMESVIDWSFQRLSEQAKRVFQVLAPFEGGANLEAITWCGERMGMDAWDVPVAVTDLVHQSLLLADTKAGRYRHTTLAKEFAMNQLEAAGEAESAFQAHADYFTDLARRAARDWFGPRETAWIVKLGHDSANLRLAHRTLLASGDPDKIGQAIDMAINAESTRAGIFWGRLRQSRQMIEAGLEHHPPEPTIRQVTGLSLSSWVAALQGRGEAARKLLDQAEKAAAILNCTDQHPALMYARVTLKWLIDPTVTHETLKAMLPELQAVERAFLDAEANPGDHHVAVLFTGMWAVFYGEGDVALALARRVRDAAEEAEGLWVRSWGEWVCGMAEVLHRHSADGMRHARKGMKIQFELGEKWGFVWSVHLAGLAAAKQGQYALAAKLFGAADEMLDQIGTDMPSLLPFNRVWNQAAQAGIRELGAREWANLRAEGAALTRRELMVLVDEAADSPSAERFGLSRREAEVAELLAARLSNKEIAEHLRISARTVEQHASIIFRKVGVTNRIDFAKDWRTNSGDASG